MLLTGKQVYEEYSFMKYQSTLRSNLVDLTVNDFDEVSKEFMELLERMFEEDQMIRPSINESILHESLLTKKYEPDEIGLVEPADIQKRLKIYQGEMEMYSHMWGLLYSHVVWEKKWKKRIEKNLKRILVNGKIPHEQLSEAYKFFTIEPKLLDYHTPILVEM